MYEEKKQEAYNIALQKEGRIRQVVRERQKDGVGPTRGPRI